MSAAIGFLAFGILWFVVMSGIAWTWNRHAPIVMAAGFEVKGNYQHVGWRDVVRRHTPSWSTFFAVVFLVMAISDFSLWQRIGVAFLLGVTYGLQRISQGERQWVAKGEPKRAALFGKTRDRIWYRSLAIAEWISYLFVIVFATDLIGQALQ